MKRDARIIKIKDQLFSSLKKNRAGILSGILIGTSYIPFPPWALLFCLVPLWVSILENQEPFWPGFWRGWWTQAILSLIGFYWIAYVSHEFGYLPWPISAAVLFLFVATVHIYFAFTTGAVQLLRQRWNIPNWSSVVVLACLTGLGEIFWPSLFPWNFGYTFLWSHSAIAQTADIFGFEGLSLFVLFTNAGLAWGYVEWRKTGQYRWILMKTFGALLVFSGLHFWGIEKQKEWQHPDATLHVLQVQANIGNFEKIQAERGAGFEQSIINRYFEQTRLSLKSISQRPDLVIWPESAYPDILNYNELLSRPYSAQFAKFLQEIQIPILTGGYSRTPDEKGRIKYYNALFLYGADQKPMGSPYHKTNLLVFGEYTPLTDYFPFLAEISPAGAGWSRGTGPQVLPFGEITLGPQICYESLYPEFTSSLVKMGAEVLVNLTNDSWFGPTSESYQHMTMTLARAIEARRPLLRTTNTGITTAILADGTELERSPRFQAWGGFYDVPYKKHPPLTFFSQYQSWLPLILLLFIAFATSIGWLQGKRK